MSRLDSSARLRRLQVLAVGIMLTALAVPSGVSAHNRPSAHPSRPHAAAGGAVGASLLGTWRVAASSASGTHIQTLITFTPGGGLITSESDAPGAGQGSWAALGHGRFVITSQAYNFASFGKSFGSSILRSVITLRGNSWSGSYETLLLDPAGKRLLVLHGKETARRFRVQLPGS